MQQPSGTVAPLGTLAFWIGMGLAARSYPSEYDWRYMTMSSSVYAERNPSGFLWARAGLILCGVAGLYWTAELLQGWRRLFGEVVGEVQLAQGGAYPGSPAGVFGWVRSPSGAIVLFEVNGVETGPRAINDEGDIVGLINPASGGQNGFVINVRELPPFEPGKMPIKGVTVKGDNLLAVPGQAYTAAEGVTDSGLVMGNISDGVSEEMGFVTQLHKH